MQSRATRSLRSRAVFDYSEVKRRGKRKERSTAYVDASGKRHATGVTLRKRIEVGALTIDRIVGDRYEWRDGRYKVRRVVVYDDGG